MCVQILGCCPSCLNACFLGVEKMAKRMAKVFIITIITILLIPQTNAFASTDIRYPESEGTIRVNARIGFDPSDPEGGDLIAEESIVEDEDLIAEEPIVEGEDLIAEEPPSSGIPTVTLPQAGATQMDMSAVGFGLLLIAGMSIYLKQKTPSNHVDKIE